MTNRVLAYARGFAEYGADVKLCYLISDKQRNKYEIRIPGVEILNLWESDGFLGKQNRYVSLLVNILRLKQYIRPNDCVFVCDGESVIVNAALLKTDNVYVEITEHPFMTGSFENTRLSYSKRRLLSRVKGLFVISKSLKHYFIKNGIKSQKIHISNMFVDINRFNLVKSIITEKYFAYCGVVSIYKDGVDSLLKAFSEFVESYPGYKLYIIGRFESSQVKEKLLQLTESLRISSSVVFTGLIDPVRIPELLINAQALVLARPNNLQAKYGFPTKLGEYLATGNPVIVTNVGEVGNFIKNYESGIVSPPDNPSAFSQCMKWVVDNPDEAKRIGLTGKALANNEFSYRTQCKMVLDVLES
ncbi:MAG: glycosyltransferase family 4 protein [Bacteroidales bacterium]|nr:glycosyltransferase family 4 protein [Bacteroidales bacterium]